MNPRHFGLLAKCFAQVPSPERIAEDGRAFTVQSDRSELDSRCFVLCPPETWPKVSLTGKHGLMLIRIFFWARWKGIFRRVLLQGDQILPAWQELLIGSLAAGAADVQVGRLSQWAYTGVIQGLYRGMLGFIGLYRDSAKENGSYSNGLYADTRGFRLRM